MTRPLLAALLLAASTSRAGNPANPILFVTQVPIAEEVNSRDVPLSFQSTVSPFSNHLPDTAHAARGGSLLERFSNGQVVDLLAVGDWSAVASAKPAANTIAVRNPAVNWTADKAMFSMVVGAPTGPTDTSTFVWQLYEITLPTQAQLAANTKPVLSKVANQPPYNNVFPAYAPGGRIVFASDRPYNGQAHLTQREEYLGLPTVSGLWILDPASAASIQLLHHAPSGAFSPSIDSAGRLIFTSWDHLSRDSEAVADSRPGVTTSPYNETFTQTVNGSGNFADETASSAFTAVTAMAPNSWESFPEPRNFDKKLLIDGFGGNLNGNSFNIFMPWMINLDGTGGEILNHVGRHEIAGGFTKNFKNDPNIVDLNPLVNPGYGNLGVRTFGNNFLATREDPLNPGRFYTVDSPDLGTHSAGQILRLDNAGVTASGNPVNPDTMTVTYVTGGAGGKDKPSVPPVKGSMNLPASTFFVPLTAANAETLYRTPIPLTDTNLVASVAANVTQTDYNAGTVANPVSLYTFRLASLKPSAGKYVPDVTLTTGIPLNTSYYVGSTLVSWAGTAWELDPAEVVARTPPTSATYGGVDPIEAGVFASSGVDVATFQNYLRNIGAALSVSRDVTKRDGHDRQQPFNLRVAWSGKQTTGTSGTVYNVAWLQILEADLRRGYTLGASTPAPGRRVVPTPMHSTMAENVPIAGAPAGSVKLGDDGSFAAIVPAQKALTWHLLNNDPALTSQVKERFWVTFQKGEIRTCANCHGINTADQQGSQVRPSHPPQALAALLQFWKGTHPAGSVQHAKATTDVASAAGPVTLSVSRTGGSTGPARVDFATVNGTATAGVDFAPATGTLSWADGDATPKTITITLLGSTFTGSARTLSVQLSNAVFASIGTLSTTAINLTGTVGGTPPAITQQPANQSVKAGQTATFSVQATGTSPLAYQWTRNSTPISGATSASYTTPATIAADDGSSFAVVVSNAAGSVTSSAATLTVTVPPSITQPPAAQTVNAGQAATFTVQASGSAPMTYAWLKQGSLITGATSASYTTPPTTASDDGAVFSVTVTNSAGSVTSQGAALTVRPPPVITKHPANQAVSAGQAATFSVQATGTGILSFQWTRGGTDIAGANAATYALATTDVLDDGARFRVRVTDLGGTTNSNEATLAVLVKPTLVQPPVDATALVGQSASFTVVATGSAPLTYAWKRDGAAIAGAGATYTIPSIVPGDDGAKFSVTVSNAAGSVDSPSVTLTVVALPTAPRILKDLADLHVIAGRAALFSVQADGTSPLRYAWSRDGVALAGVTGPSLLVDPVLADDDGARFSVVVQNARGDAPSASAVLHVVVPPSIRKGPLPQTVFSGEVASFSVEASGTAPIAYQWKRDGAVLDGATAASITTAATTIADTGASFSVVISNAGGSVESAAASLTVTLRPVAPHIVTPPASVLVATGKPATFSVVADGTGPLAYVWRRDGETIEGETEATYTTPPTVLADAGAMIFVVVSNAVGEVESAGARLDVADPPTIVDAPRGVQLSPGQDATFRVKATGTGPISFEWRRDGVAIPLETGPSLVVPAVTKVDSGARFEVVVSNAVGTVTSDPVVLTVSDPLVAGGGSDGCGCSTSDPASWLLLALGALPGLRRGRRSS